ncbi:WXG100 family type VII secretion target [Gordonia alkanivorans]|uniref:ESAT-6-like protein n=1 Tax=Gordonia alkanivorans NBRC 16433 TaxID=1027371 RepID=F9VZN3_9ACTN|nr:WXG100 family type VII secretion target [Gordonia alkanivorans]MDH3011553.1 WXG100 family type VII secretion target [Gordonia alkanivorans]MDH3045881.1 WXG100 family type VII secretion target [Gordonia alkanivorans]MDH3050280.1 WXG100 family type VII secretion target [Gordonia alkanivorans]MDJ0007933.1 WXG100 family type VII secretion target [Gordonia alkanivorans]MDJ0025568.1 WXG100 family type VII secretion target [Gordonia alkanivorans]
MTINYDFAALGDLSSGLGRAFQQLDDQNTQLKNQVAALDGNWNSAQAKAAYIEAQANFDRAFAQSRERLMALQNGVTNASRTMSDTDSSIASGFRSLA